MLTREGDDNSRKIAAQSRLGSVAAHLLWRAFQANLALLP